MVPLKVNLFANEPITIPVFVPIVNDAIWPDSGWFIFVQVAEKPSFFGDYSFALFVNVENRRFKWFTVFEVEGSEHTNLPNVCLINNTFLILLTKTYF
jgi:hypothetical protein